MGERPMSARANREADVIPFRRAGGTVPAVPGLMRSFGADAWTVRPRDVVLLLPLIIPLTAAILLGLLGWFVAWLLVVAVLAVAIVLTDLTRRAIRRMTAPALQPLDREAISFQGR